MEAWLESGHTPYKVHSWFHGAANMDERQYWPIRHHCYQLIESLEPGLDNRVKRTFELFGIKNKRLNSPDIVEKFKMLAGPYGKVYYQMLKARADAKSKGR